jgi:hypothetical protein
MRIMNAFGASGTAFLFMLTLGVRALSARQIRGADGVPTPASVLGFEPGADYRLATYEQIAAYFARLAQSSDRIRIDTIGRSVRGRPIILAFISSAENLRQLERYRSISARLARARELEDAQARALAREGKAVVWIDAGIHGDEVAPPQHMPLLAYRLVSGEADDVRRIREDAIALIMPVINPDGADIVADWYGGIVHTPFENAPLPVLYHHYVGVDLNRDWYMYTQPETRAVGRVLYHEWFPQITYNQHQAPPFPARIFVPPLADPVNPNIPPAVTRGTNLVGSAMARRFEEEGKPGVVSRVAFDMWWNGGIRSAAYYHNMIALLTETAQNHYANPRYYPPDSLPPFLGGTGVSASQPSVFYPNPWRGGWWRLRDAVEYNYTAAVGVLDIAAKLKEDWLYGIYRLGRDAIEKGMHEAPFAYVISREQWDRSEALELVRLLRYAGIEVQRAVQPFTAGPERGASHAAGTFIAYAAQAFRPYLIDLMEKQVYPDVRAYPGGPPQPPYDLSGWTLPIQMGVTVKRVDAPFTALVEPVADVPVTPGRVPARGAAAYLLSHRDNASATAVNRLLAAGVPVARLTASHRADGERHDPGTFVVAGGASARAQIERLARELGVDFAAAGGTVRLPTSPLRQPRIALYKSWVGDWIVRNGRWEWVANIGEGWTRWVLERHAFPVDTLHDADIRNGDLSRYDVLILPEQEPAVILSGHAPGTMPPEYTGGIGGAGAERIRAFVEQGGRLVAIDAAANFAIDLFGLPVRDVTKDVPSSRFFVPGTLIRITLDPSHPLAHGLPADGAAFFVRSRAFELLDAAAQGAAPPARTAARISVAARYPEDGLLLSGWALGEQEVLGGKAAVLEAQVGRGSVVLIGFRPLFRGQPRNTFKLVFNSIYGGIRPVR